MTASTPVTAPSPTFSDAIHDLDRAQQELLGALSLVGASVVHQVSQIAAMVQLLNRRALDGSPRAPRPESQLAEAPSLPRSASLRLDADLIAGLRQAEAAIRRGHHRTRFGDANHPTLTELARLETELVTASFGPVLHALVEMTIAADALDDVLAASGLPPVAVE